MNFIFVKKITRLENTELIFFNLGIICPCICIGRLLFKDTFWDQILTFKLYLKFNEGLFLEIHYLKSVCKIPCLNYIQFFLVC